MALDGVFDLALAGLAASLRALEGVLEREGVLAREGVLDLAGFSSVDFLAGVLDLVVEAGFSSDLAPATTFLGVGAACGVHESVAGWRVAAEERQMQPAAATTLTLVDLTGVTSGEASMGLRALRRGGARRSNGGQSRAW